MMKRTNLDDWLLCIGFKVEHNRNMHRKDSIHLPQHNYFYAFFLWHMLQQYVDL